MSAVETNTMNLDTAEPSRAAAPPAPLGGGSYELSSSAGEADSNMMELSASAIPVTPPRDEEGDAVCPPAPRRRARSPSEEVEAAAYDAVVRQLVGELTTRLDTLPAMEGLVSPSGLQRQQAFDPDAPQIHSPMVDDSPAALYVVGAGRQVSAEMDLAAAAVASAESPLKHRETSSEAGDQVASPLKRRETDIESDLSVAAASADTNTCELPATSEGDEVESESESESEEEMTDGEEADNESGGDEVETNTEDAIHHVEADETNTSGLYLSFHRQKGSGELAVRLEAPVWMVGVLLSVVTTYMWMVVYLIKAR